MQADPKASMNGHAPSVEPRDGTRSELDELRATCRRQAHVIDALTAAVGTLRRGAQALKAENADLRAQTARARSQRRSPARPHGGVNGSERIEARFALDVHAPAAARSTIADCLGDRVAPAVLDNAMLLATELVTNSVRHSGMPASAGVAVAITITPVNVRLDVDDPGRGGTIAPRPPDEERGGFGLNLVQTLSERWGVERAAQGGTRVWAQLSRAPSPRRRHPHNATETACPRLKMASESRIARGGWTSPGCVESG
jgi:anti-sigma regulatory factor (Ser/Thr protein kinase)